MKTYYSKIGLTTFENAITLNTVLLYYWYLLSLCNCHASDKTEFQGLATRIGRKIIIIVPIPTIIGIIIDDKSSKYCLKHVRDPDSFFTI